MNHKADSSNTPLISVVIPCFNQAMYLGEAIDSVLAQTYQNFEVVVIDDGSTDATPDIAGQYTQVRCIKQTNQGLAAARNAGNRASKGRYLVFLDADDRLLPNALSAGLQCIEKHPDCAFVSGGYRRIDKAGVPIEKPTPARIEKDHYLAFLRGNYVGMHGTVLYQRQFLTDSGGFCRSLPACEDYELYLRLARVYPVHCHDAVVAEYRTYDSSMSADVAFMLHTALKVLDSQRKYLNNDRRRIEAHRTGVGYWKGLYAQEFLTLLSPSLARGEFVRIVRGVLAMSLHAPRQFWRLALRRGARAALPTPILRLLARLRGYPYHPPVGRIRFGDLRRVAPISEWFGFDRGLPIDRYYIERFLADYSEDIRGRVLEVGDSNYTRQFGDDRVTKSDVLHVSEGNPLATFVGDLTCADHIPSETFDCVIFTQTLHLIYDVRAALSTLYRILKPNGVLLLTVPGISQISHDEWGKSWFWNFTSLSIRRLLEEAFPKDCVAIKAYGNALVATSFLQGIATSELEQTELDFRDPHYEVLITVRASRPSSESES
ncbi:bifunctional glycosyltransferase/class I SAM-dependent methyltransferase [bacterium]|nr:bifunctional glycosyltransferase/class I SAM-dependent methyltransferase [bacterium]